MFFNILKNINEIISFYGNKDSMNVFCSLYKPEYFMLHYSIAQKLFML